MDKLPEDAGQEEGYSRMNVLWIQRLACCGNTHSFLNYEALASLFEEFNFLYHPSLSGEEEEAVTAEVLKGKVKVDVLIVEGAVGKGDEELRRLASVADYVVAVGSCASYGNIPALGDDNVCGLQYRFKEKGGLLGKNFRSSKGREVINVSGCPAHPEWIAGTLFDIKMGRLSLDSLNRPKRFYESLTHWGCSRNEFFEWKVELVKLGSSRGCLFYKFGCRGPMTGSTCNVTLWNGVSSKTRAGYPCFGCTEFDFPRKDLWETKVFAGVPADLPKGVSKRAYIMISGIAKMFTPERLKE